MATSACGEAYMQELSLKRSGDSQDGPKKPLFDEELEKSELMEQKLRDDRCKSKRASGVASKQDAASQAVIWESVENSEGEDECEQSKGHDQLQEMSRNGDHDKEEPDDKTDASPQDVKKETREKPAKRVSLLEFTEILDV